MTKQNYIYLFELDPVRESDDEILAGLSAIHDEIVRNGNAVVLTYEQLIDSQVFFSLMADRAFYQDVLQLFRQGCIQISQSGDIRTAVQYLLRKLDRKLDDRRPFLSLPLQFTQGRLIALTRRSLLYSDLSELREYLEGGCRSDREVEGLFLQSLSIARLRTGRPVRFCQTGGCGRMASVLGNIRNESLISIQEKLCRHLHSFLGLQEVVAAGRKD